MIPASERFVVRIPVVAIHNCLELTPIDGFKKLPEDARCKAHAPFLF